VVKEKNPEWMIPKSERKNLPAENPGPGSYNPQKKATSIKFAIGSKTLNDKMFKVVADG